MKTKEGVFNMTKMIKQVFVAAMLTIFILSVMPVVLAHHGEKDDRLLVRADVDARIEVEDNDSDSSRSDTRVEVRAEQKNERSQIRIVKEEIKEVREVREELKERVEKLKEQYKEERKDLKEARKEYEKQRDDFLQAKARVRVCRSDSEECNIIRVELKRGVVNHLDRTFTLIDSSLAKLKERVDGAQNLDATEKQRALEAIVSLEENLTLQRSEVEALAVNATNEELKAAIKDLKDTWHNVRKIERRIIAMLMNQKLDTLVEKHQEYVNGLQLRVDTLAQAGVDVSELEDILVEFKAQVQLLEEHHAKLETVWAEDVSFERNAESWHRVQKKMKEDLEKSHELLRKFMRVYAKLKGEVHTNATATVTVEE